MTYLALLILIFAQPARASVGQTIRYQNGSASFVLERSVKAMTLHHGTSRDEFPIRACNRDLLERFFARAWREASRFPAIKPGPRNPAGLVVTDKTTRWLRQRPSAVLNLLPNEIPALRVQEAALCSGH